MKNYLELFLKQIQIKGSKKTAALYEKNINKFLAKYKKKVDDYTYEDLVDYFTSFGEIKINTKRTYMAAILSYFKFLYEQNYIDKDITRGFKMPKAEVRDMEYLTSDEAKEIANICMKQSRNPLRKKAMLVTLVNTGMRASELCSLKFSDIKDDWIYVNHGKGNKARKIPLHDSVKTAIDDYVAKERKKCDSDYIFINQGGNTLKPLNIDRDLNYVLKNSNINKHISAHRLRDSFATIQYINGSDIKSIQETLGHATIQMTLHYVQKVDTIRQQQILNAGVNF